MRPALPACGPDHVSIGGLIALLRTLKTVVLSLGVGAALALAGIQPAQAAPAAAAQITLNPTQGPAGSAVTVAGAADLSFSPIGNVLLTKLSVVQRTTVLP